MPENRCSKKIKWGRNSDTLRAICIAALNGFKDPNEKAESVRLNIKSKIKLCYLNKYILNTKTYIK